ncbi:PREDICTED: uncharacterized protein LOC104743391 [Camelina sativa]|uniref:Uncharacterized protein LOC104743391 n=1 Tax=Camelina sativa TaxID=90675 RepID=A0ABM1QW79_CAMSA|nr:PREDICTED: uncharacterized protein LOC104743391 [Camelina sativa]
MTIMNSTIITWCPPLSPDYFLDLATYSDILAEDGLNENILIDVVGQVVSRGEMKTSEINDKPKKRVEVELLCHDANDSMVICFIRLAKINSYNGTRTISNAYDMSLMLINPDHPDVLDFVSTLSKDDLKLTFCERNCKFLKQNNDKVDYINQFPRSTISDLLEATMEGKFKLVCAIYHIDMEFGWYKLVLDVMDSTSETKFILFDHNALKLVNQTATDVLGGNYDEIQDPTIVPGALQSLVGKTFMFLASVETSNIVDGKETYKVSYVEMGDSSTHVDNIEDSEAPADPRDVISIEDHDQDCVSHGHDIGTSVTTPSSKCKEEATEDAYAHSSTSKKICLPSIKEAIDEAGVKAPTNEADEG